LLAPAPATVLLMNVAIDDAAPALLLLLLLLLSLLLALLLPPLLPAPPPPCSSSKGLYCEINVPHSLGVVDERVEVGSPISIVVNALPVLPTFVINSSGAGRSLLYR
jgi:hypothetical protein